MTLTIIYYSNNVLSIVYREWEPQPTFSTRSTLLNALLGAHTYRLGVRFFMPKFQIRHPD